jgi:hypothetical protein
VKTVLALIVMSLALLTTATTATASPQPGCAIDENGNCVDYCDYYSGYTPDCFIDTGYFESDVDVYYDFNAGSYCFNVKATRKGTWWAVHLNRIHVCTNETVTSLGSPQIYASSSLWPPVSYVYGPDLSYDGPYDSGVGSGFAGSTINFNFRWCSWAKCGTRVYGSITIYVGGDGGLYCFSDKGYIPNCRGRVW